MRRSGHRRRPARNDSRARCWWKGVPGRPDREGATRASIGESLLPANLPLFERMGIADEVKAIGMVKWGAEFVSPHHDIPPGLQLRRRLGQGRCPRLPGPARRVRRDPDPQRGAGRASRCIEGCKAPPSISCRRHGDRPRATTTAGPEWHARFVVDASGRDTFLANRFQISSATPGTTVRRCTAISPTPGARRRAEGNITIFWFDHGWFWFIPLMTAPPASACDLALLLHEDQGERTSTSS